MRAGREVWAVWLAAVAAGLVFLALAVAQPEEGTTAQICALALVTALSAAAMIMRARYLPEHTVTCAMIAGAVCAFGYTGAYYLAVPDSPAEFPSPAEVGAVGYLMAGAGFVLFGRGVFNNLPRALWLDALIGGLALAAVAQVVVHVGLAEGAEVNALERGQLLYIAADFILAGFVFVAWGLGGFQRSALLVLGVGALMMGIADATFTVRVFDGHDEWPPLLAALWTAALVTIAGSSVMSPLDPALRRHPRAGSLVSVPVVAALVALGIHLLDHGQSDIALTLATVVLILSVIRLAMSLLDNQRAEERRRREDQERRAREEAERANREKTAFLSRMSHEVRTPLNSILGFAQLLVDDVDAAERESVERILRAGNHLRELIDDILDLSTIEAGETAISIEALPVEPGVDEAMALLEPLARRHRVRVVRRDAAGGAGRALADPGRLNQVLLNLISNAIKYGGAESEVVVRSERLGESVRISVIDSGPGIPDEHRAKLFMPFERGSARGSGVEGSGLGLALAKNLVERMHGQIGLDTGPGGSTFWFTLPAADAAGADGGLSPGHERTVGAAGDGALTLLYIEDHTSNIALVERLLARRDDYDLITATTGRAGLRRAVELLPDAVLLDLDLPDMRGEEVLAELRADAATAGIPVIVVSADVTARRQEELMRSGAAAYIVKPLQLASFLAALDEVLRGTPSQS